MITQKMKKTYKQTELGVIPVDWKCTKFEDVISEFSVGQTPSRSKPDYFKGNILWITSGELNYNVITDTIEKITEEGARSANLRLLPKGTFLFSIIGLEAEGTRGTCAITGLAATANQSTMALFPNEDILTTDYLFHFYVTYGNRLALKYCQGTKQQNYTAGTAKQLPINIPPTIEEQKAITEILSNCTALIELLERLIEKKKNIKQGAMQEILTGKKRLSGFRSGWVIKNISEIGKCFAGGTPSTFKSEYWNGEIIWLPSGRVQNNYIEKLTDEKTITKLGLENSATKLIHPKSVLIAITGATCGNIGLLEFEATANQSVVAIEPFVDYYYKFLYYVLLSKRNKILSLQGGSAQGGINLSSIKKFQVMLPEDKEEQIAIADILSDMDLEIEILVRKRDKCKLLKVGLMQQLLTGRIRLKCPS